MNDSLPAQIRLAEQEYLKGQIAREIRHFTSAQEAHRRYLVILNAHLQEVSGAVDPACAAAGEITPTIPTGEDYGLSDTL